MSTTRAPFKYSYFQLTFGQEETYLNPHLTYERLTRCGYDAIEICPPKGRYGMGVSMEDYLATHKQLKADFGLEVSNVNECWGEMWDPYSPDFKTLTEPVTAELAVNETKATIDFAAELGARSVTLATAVHAPITADNVDDATAVAVDSLQRMSDHARTRRPEGELGDRAVGPRQGSRQRHPTDDLRCLDTARHRRPVDQREPRLRSGQDPSLRDEPWRCCRDDRFRAVQGRFCPEPHPDVEVSLGCSGGSEVVHVSTANVVDDRGVRGGHRTLVDLTVEVSVIQLASYRGVRVGVERFARHGVMVSYQRRTVGGGL